MLIGIMSAMRIIQTRIIAIKMIAIMIRHIFQYKLIQQPVKNHQYQVSILVKKCLKSVN
jgi:hypothetical protein